MSELPILNQNKSLTGVKPFVPPHSIEAEQSVLGGLMLDANLFDQVVDRLSENDFYKKEHRFIYAAMERLAAQQRPIDVVTVSAHLNERGEMNQFDGGENYLFMLSHYTPSTANIIAYADIVRERSILRKLISAAHDIAQEAVQSDGRSITDIVDAAERKVFSISEQGGRGEGPQNIKSYLTHTLDKISTLSKSNSPITGMPTGYDDLDYLTAGLQPADLVIVAGRPSMGKTLLGVNIAEHVAIKNKLPILIFSMEMPGDALVMRLLSSLARIDQTHIRTGKLADHDWARLSSSVGVLSEAPIYIDETPALTPAELRARARRLYKEKGKLGLVVVDYLQLMRVSGMSDNRTAEISEISRSLKTLAKELNVPVIAISQLNRSLEQRADKRPVMSDLRESGAIEQDADLIAFIYRDEVYNENSPEKGIAEIIIAKQRNGPIGKIRLKFFGQFCRFDNFSGRDDVRA